MRLGNPRAVDLVGISNGAGTNTVDLGAVEMEAGSLVVTTTADVVNRYDHETSLREAVAFANSDPNVSSISFASGAGEAFETPQTIILTGGELQLTSSLSINGDTDGDNKADVTLDGNNASRIALIDGGSTFVALNALNLTDGDTSGNGGALYANNGATLALSFSSVFGNFANSGAGIAAANSASLDVTTSTISANSASGYGGGVYGTSGANVSLKNVTLEGNVALNSGGGVSNYFGALTAINTTITGNYAGTYGGGLEASGTETLINTLIAGNNTGGSYANVAGTVDTSTNNVIDATPSTVFATLNGISGGGQKADNGGPVETVALLASTTNPAVDVGAVAGFLTSDAIGNARDVDVPGVNNGGTVDAGAVELVAEAQSLHVTTNQDVVNPFDGVTSLREAVTFANSNPDQSDITFAAGPGKPFENSGIITLTGGVLDLTSDISIEGDADGDGFNNVGVSGNNASTVFSVTGAGTDVDLNGLLIFNGSGTYGGGAYVGVGASLDVSATTFFNNDASARGGGLHNQGGTVTVTASEFSQNTAGSDGGGLSLVGGNATVTNTTVANNTAANALSGGYGGGIFGVGNLTLVNSTLTGNSGFLGGGIYAGGTETVINSIIAGNSGGNIFGLVETSTDNVIDGDPALIFESVDATYGGGQIANNGGSIFTAALRLDPTNPALDIGALAGGLTTDAVGNARDVDRVDVNNGGTVDAGALEAPEVPSLVVTTTADVVDASDGVTSLREAVNLANSNPDQSDITFAVNGTVTLTQGQISLSSDISINGDTNGDGAADVTLSGNNASRIFDITGTGTDVDLHALRFVYGRGFQGGAVRSAAFTSLDVSNSTFTDNMASQNGGAIYVFGTDFTLANSLIGFNSASAGGGLNNRDGTATIENSTIVGNTSDYGGGIASYGAFTAINTTITDNSANVGGGITASGNETIINSIISGNRARFTSANVSGTIETATDNVVDATPEDVFAALSPNGGGALDLTVPDPVLAVALKNSAFNPAIDVGLVAGGLTSDVRGNARSVDTSKADGSGPVDAGALEVQITAGTSSGEGLSGTSGADWIEGLGGGDTINALGAGDVVFGGLGDDSIAGGGFADEAFGEAGNDTINGDGGNDFIRGGADDDLINGGAGNDTLGGDDNDDTLLGENGDDSLEGNDGNDRLEGGGGEDTLLGGDGHDRILGEENPDYIDGGRGDDTLQGAIGDDTIFGGEGNDNISGANARDSIDGGDGNDTILGQGQEDTLFGGADNDSINGGASADSINGDAGDDTLDGGAFNDFVDGGDDNDIVLGNSGRDTLYGGSGNDTLGGGSSNDTLFGGDNDDVLTGGIGSDVLYGEADNDVLNGGNANDTLFGGTGVDTLNGDSGSDVLQGGAGADIVNGGTGLDTLLVAAGEGGDTLTGGAGSDTFDFATGFGTATIADFAIGADKIDLVDAAPNAFGDLMITYGADALVDLDGSDSLILVGITTGLSASDFVFA